MDYHKAKELIGKSEGFSEIKFNEVDVSIFTYRYSKYENFQIDPMMKWFRGLTFVNKTNVYPMLPKFFNINENQGNMLEDLKNMEIKLVTEKRDGSLIMPIRINGTIKFKTMKSINNNIINKCEKIFLHKYKSFIEKYIDEYSILFEYTSPTNKIVVEYEKYDITLIAMVDRSTFKIMWYNEINKIANEHNVKIVESIDINNMDTLIKMSETIENKEGWVITLEDKNGDQKMVKLKTCWYSSLHGNFQSINKRIIPTSMIIKLILNNKIDDVIPYVQNQERKKQIIDIENKINVECGRIFNIISDSLNEYEHNFERDKKKFVQYLKNPVNKMSTYINIILTSIGNGNYQSTSIENNVYKNIKKHIIKETNTDSKANAYLSKI